MGRAPSGSKRRKTAGYFVVVVVVVDTLSHEALQLLKSVVHLVVQSSLSHLSTQSLLT